MNQDVHEALRAVERACMRLRWALEDNPKPNGHDGPIRAGDEPLTMRMIMSAVSKVSGISEESLSGSRRNRSVARPRQLALYLSTTLLTHRSFPEIGKFYNKDHTTVIHARKKVEELLETDPDFAETKRLVCEELGI